MYLEGARALAAHPSHKGMCSSHVYRILECSCELCESASTPVDHAVTSLPPSHATQGGSTHVHDPQVVIVSPGLPHRVRTHLSLLLLGGATMTLCKSY